MTLNELIENFSKENLENFLYTSQGSDLNALYTGKNPNYLGTTILSQIFLS